MIEINYSRKWIKTYTFRRIIPKNNKCIHAWAPKQWAWNENKNQQTLCVLLCFILNILIHFWREKKHLKKKKTHWLHAKHESSCINKIRINVPWHWIHIGLLNFQRVRRALNGNTNSPMNLVHLGGFYACCAHNKTSPNRKSRSARFFGVNTFCLPYELNR